jgi:hypothetical protein
MWVKDIFEVCYTEYILGVQYYYHMGGSFRSAISEPFGMLETNFSCHISPIKMVEERTHKNVRHVYF